MKSFDGGGGLPTSGQSNVSAPEASGGNEPDTFRRLTKDVSQAGYIAPRIAKMLAAHDSEGISPRRIQASLTSRALFQGDAEIIGSVPNIRMCIE